MGDLYRDWPAQQAEAATTGHLVPERHLTLTLVCDTCGPLARGTGDKRALLNRAAARHDEDNPGHHARTTERSTHG